MLKKIFLFVLISLHLPLTANVAVNAADVFNNNVCNRGVESGAEDPKKSAVCKDENTAGENPLFGPQGIITKIIKLLSSVVAIIAIITIVLAGLKFITSGTNSQDVNKAREQIIYAAIALGVAALAQAIVRLIVERI